MAVKGLDTVLRNLNREIQGIEGRTRKGFQKVGAVIKADSMEDTPVEFGVLDNSAFADTDNGLGKGPRVRVGYTAKYAPFVHEMPTSNNFTKVGTGPKFLEKAVKKNIALILKVIRNSAKVR